MWLGLARTGPKHGHYILLFVVCGHNTDATAVTCLFVCLFFLFLFFLCVDSDIGLDTDAVFVVCGQGWTLTLCMLCVVRAGQ